MERESGKTPAPLRDEIKLIPDDMPIFTMFFEMYQNGKEFYQTIFYYQQVIGVEFDGEDLTLLLSMWQCADKYVRDKENKKLTKSKGAGKPKGRP